MHAARGTQGAVAAGSEYADEAGMRIYFHGGNAVDAGVATMFAASVIRVLALRHGRRSAHPDPHQGRQGLRHRGRRHHAEAGHGGNFSWSTGRRPGEILTLDPGGLKGIIPVAGILAGAGAEHGGSRLVALRDFGTKSFSEDIEPAIELADGMAIDEMRAGAIARSRRFFDLWPASKKTFMPDGRVPLPGEIFRQPDLARTLRAMAAAEKKALAAGATRAAAIDAVADYFYRGEIAHKIDAFMQANGGLLRYEDMAAFKLQPEEPVSTDYHGYKVYKPGFWSQGPAMIEALNILEGFDLRSMGFNSAGVHSHRDRSAEAGLRRSRHLLRRSEVQQHSRRHAALERYAAERRKLIGHNASMDFLPGMINGKRGKHPTEMDIARTKIDDALMANDTTCVDAIDKDGMVFSATPSGAWLPSVIAGDTGIPLTERAQQFVLVPGSPTNWRAASGPRVTLSPTIVTEHGKPFLALSTPGGDNQEQGLIQLFFNVDRVRR